MDQQTLQSCLSVKTCSLCPGTQRGKREGEKKGTTVPNDKLLEIKANPKMKTQPLTTYYHVSQEGTEACGRLPGCVHSPHDDRAGH